jgi:hypothetical protein
MRVGQRDRVSQIELPDVSPFDVLATIRTALHPRTYDSSERFAPLASLQPLRQHFTDHGFRVQCELRRVGFDIHGLVGPSAAGGTCLRIAVRPSGLAVDYVLGVVSLACVSVAAWREPRAVWLLVFWLALVLAWPAHVRDARRRLDTIVRGLGPFLLERTSECIGNVAQDAQIERDT